MIDFSRFNSIFELTDYFDTEDKCRRVIRDSRWDKHDIVCPYCGEHHCVDSSGLNVPPVAETNVPGIAETNVPAVAE